jgi:hypothetical protein
VENPEFKRKLDRMVEINQKINAVNESNDVSFVKNLKKIPLVAALVSELIAAYLMPPMERHLLKYKIVNMVIIGLQSHHRLINGLERF